MTITPPSNTTPSNTSLFEIRGLAATARAATLAAAAIALSACAGSYTGPVEVTRFVAAPSAAPSAALAQGTIGIAFPEEMQNQTARNAFAAAVADELATLGYTVILDGSATPAQTAQVRTTRNAVAAASSRGPVRVGVGAGTGGFRSGVGAGVGIDLGSSRSGPDVLTELSVRISGPDGASLWEGRAQQPVSMKSPYADVEASARTLAAALFRDFPGGNGETVMIEVEDLASQ